jgi:threonine dehydratase
MQKLTAVPTALQIEKIHAVITPFIHQTPVLTSQAINTMVGAELYFKCENFQKVGAFKMRGAMSAVLALTSEEKKYGVATHSSGNHAQALALTAKTLGIPAYIVMPENTPSIKKEATSGYGATITTSGNTQTDRVRTLERILKKTKATFIPSFNHYNVIGGQATAAKELLDQTKKLDVVIAPVGGGGLLSGTALSIHYWSPRTITLGAEPELVDDAARSVLLGSIQSNTRIDTIADGLRTTLGDKTFPIIQNYVHEIITVSEEEIKAATQLLWSRLKIVVEPSGAVPLAAILKTKNRWSGKSIGLILSGGNVELPILGEEN